MPSSRPSATRAPALFLLGGMIAGFSLAAAVPAAPPMYLALGAFLLAGLSATFHASGARWALCYLLAATLGGWAYGIERLPRNPSPEELQLPPREAELIVTIDRVMQPESRYGEATGLATLDQSLTPGGWDKGDRIYFAIDLSGSKSARIEAGTRIQLTGVFESVRPSQDARRSFEHYLNRTGIHYRLSRTTNLRQLEAPGWWEAFGNSMNQRFQEFLRAGAPESTEVVGIYTAMLLGLKSELSPRQKENFRLTGTMHFFAISGLHIGIIATVVGQALLLLRVPPKARPLLGLPLVFLYVEITGSPPSAIRAFLMAAFFWASLTINRQRSPFAALVGSAVAVLVWDPAQLWSIGFQLSYAVVASILLFGLPLHQHLCHAIRPFRWLPEESWSRGQHFLRQALEAILLLFSISFAAWLASAPLSAGIFGFIAPGAILLNMLLIHLAGIVLVTGVLSLGFGLFGLLPVSAFINHAAWLVISTMEAIVRAGNQLQATTIQTDAFPLHLGYAILLVYLASLLRIQNKRLAAPNRQILWPSTVVLLGLSAGLTFSAIFLK